MRRTSSESVYRRARMTTPAVVPNTTRANAVTTQRRHQRYMNSGETSTFDERGRQFPVASSPSRFARAPNDRRPPLARNVANPKPASTSNIGIAGAR
jgi:hypothetical protein